MTNKLSLSSTILLGVEDRLGVIYAMGAAVLFSFKPIMVKLIYAYDIETLTVLAWRMILSLPIYLIIGLIIYLKSSPYTSTERPSFRIYLYACLIGLLGYYLAAVLDLQGLKTVTAQLERLILFSSPTWVAILSWLILKKTLQARTGWAILLSYLGIAIMIVSDWKQVGDNILMGSTWILLAALSFSLYVVLSKPLIDKIGAKEFTVIAMTSSSLIALAHFSIIHDWQALRIPIEAFWLVGIMAILCTVIPTFLLAAAIARIGPSNTSVTGTIGPVATALFAAWLLDENFGWPQFVGLILVLVAVMLVQSKPRELA